MSDRWRHLLTRWCTGCGAHEPRSPGGATARGRSSEGGIGSLGAAGVLLAAVLTIAFITNASGMSAELGQPPFAVGDLSDLVQILRDDLLVLALHAMACVAGFMAGSSLPLQAEHHTGLVRVIHQRGQPVAMAFVVRATGFSLSLQAYTIGTAAAQDAAALHASPAVLLFGLLPHALPELVALFLPPAAWIVASRRGEWGPPAGRDDRHRLARGANADPGGGMGCLSGAALLAAIVG